MASGDTLFLLSAENFKPTATLSATPDIVVDASTPATETPVYDFDGGQDESVDIPFQVPSFYSEDTGFTFSYKYSMDGTDGDAVELEFRVIKFTDTSTVLTADLGIDTATPAVLADTPSDSVANTWNVSGAVALAKADMGNPAPEDRMVLRITRDSDHAANADDLQLANVYVTET